MSIPARNADSVSDYAPAGPRTLLTVSAVTAMVKDALAEHLPPTLHVVGQISNLKRHGSGHLYLTLKDETSELSSVMWRSSAEKLAFEPQDGMEVIATGYVDVFERAGRYQLYCRKLEPRGVGALELAFRQLRAKLEAQGLFDPRRKRPLPRFPQRIAVVTSPTGAAVRDILQTLERRFPVAQVLMYPVIVQGPEAAGQIAGAIRELNRRREALGGIDLMIVGRGGGSLEDLWAFNEEVVARALFDSASPVISAVGHETDVTIADLVADVRAATPTAAAELAVPDRSELLMRLARLALASTRRIAARMELARANLNGITRRRALAEPLDPIRRREQWIDEIGLRIHHRCVGRLQALHGRIRRAEVILQRIHPRTLLLQRERTLIAAGDRLRWALANHLKRGERGYMSLVARILAASPLRVHQRLSDRLDNSQRRLRRAGSERLRFGRQVLDAHRRRLESVSYRRTLERGYTVTRTRNGRQLVRRPSQVADGDRIITETADGEFESRVIDPRQMDLFES